MSSARSLFSLCRSMGPRPVRPKVLRTARGAMLRRDDSHFLLPIIAWLLSAVAIFPSPCAAERDFGLEQAAIHNAIESVADSVVQITTIGGLDRVGETVLSQGPTSGLIISTDGLIVSSAFNFAQRPSSILVRLANGKQVPASLVARDLNRMLVLLKIENQEDLPVPVAVPAEDFAVGQTTIALGRTFQTEHVDVSLGILSALGRMHGRAVQTDCNVSGANYGGPLIDLRGRVIGVLVPMSPQPAHEGPESEVAGAEYYDSGIGFAVPLEQVFANLERWQSGMDLHPGKLGVGLKSGSPFVESPAIVSVWPRSPAAQLGWKAGDVIVGVDGQAVATQTQLQFFIKPRYAGDKLTISLRRGSGETAEEFDSEITLAEKLEPFRHSFLGVFPATATEVKGVAVERLWPASPAATAGVKPGDRIEKIGEAATPTLADAMVAMRSLQTGEEVTLSLERGEEAITLSAKLAGLPEEILSSDDLPKLPPAEAATPALEMKSIKLPEFPQEAKYLAPKANGKLQPGLIVWLAQSGELPDSALLSDWQEICRRQQIVLLVARPSSESGWATEDLEYLEALVRTAHGRFNVDSQRTVVVGQDKAGQLAYALALRRRQLFSGVATINAPLPRTLKIPENSPSRPLAVWTVLPKNSTFAPLIKQDIVQLREAGYPVSLTEPTPSATGFDATTKATLLRWLAGLKRL